MGVVSCFQDTTACIFGRVLGRSTVGPGYDGIHPFAVCRCVGNTAGEENLHRKTGNRTNRLVRHFAVDRIVRLPHRYYCRAAVPFYIRTIRPTSNSALNLRRRTIGLLNGILISWRYILSCMYTPTDYIHDSRLQSWSYLVRNNHFSAI